MVTPIFCCGYECGLTTDTATFGTMHFGAFQGTPAISTSTVNNGARSLRCNAAGAAVSARAVISVSNELRHVGRFYVRFASLPASDVAIWGMGAGSDPLGPNVRFKQTDSSLYAAVGTTFGASGVAVTTGVWYRVDFHGLISTAGNDTCDAQVDGVAVGQATAAGDASGTPVERLGVMGAVTCDAFFDDFIVSITAADYPFGAGKVLSFVPDSDGTHTSTGTTTKEGTIASPTGGVAITSATTDSFNWQNGVPLLGGASDNTRLVACITAASTTYAEWVMQTTGEVNVPRAVEFLIAHREASTAVCDATYKLNDGGTEGTIGGQSGAGAVSDRYVTKQFATPPTGGAWTLAKFNALRVRGGYSSDATPDVYLRGWMCEAEFPESLPATLQGGRPYGQMGAGQMQQLLAQ